MNRGVLLIVLGILAALLVNFWLGVALVVVGLALSV